MKNIHKYFLKILYLVHGLGFLLIIVNVFIKGYNGILDLILVVIFGQLFLFVVYTLPMLILVVNYKIYNKNLELEINLNKSMMVLHHTKNHEQKIIPFKSIRKVYKIDSYNKSFIHFGYMDYFFFKVILNDGKCYIITCLINENLDKYINKDKLEKDSMFFPYVKKTKHCNY